VDDLVAAAEDDLAIGHRRRRVERELALGMLVAPDDLPGLEVDGQHLVLERAVIRAVADDRR
jgi:hypothetical protein